MAKGIFRLFILGFLITISSQVAFAGCGSETQFNCMVAAINGEARGESYEGMLIVGKALKTRQLRNYYGRTICGISKRSFAPRSLRSTGTKGNTRARIIKAAKAACASGDARYTHFHSYRNKYDRRAPWAKQFAFRGKVGGHWFFNAPMGIRADFNGVVAYDDSMITEDNFITDDDIYFYEISDEEANGYYTDEDDNEVSEILRAPIDDSISI